MTTRIGMAFLVIAPLCVLAAAQEEELDLDRPPKFGVLDTLEGRVVSPDGTPVVAARVALYGYEFGADGGRFFLEQDAVQETTTDDRGRFVFDSLYGLQFPGGNVAFLFAEAEGFGPAGIPAISFGGWAEPITLRLAEPADLTLRVSPCRWRTIIVSDVDELARKVTLNSDCEARLSGLAAGRVFLRPWSEEHGNLGTGYAIDLRPHQRNEIDLTLRANSISGLVLAKGRPQADVEVKVEYVEPDEIPVGFIRKTKTNGEFAFYDLDPGRWRVSVVGQDPVAREVELAVGQEAHVELELE